MQRRFQISILSNENVIKNDENAHLLHKQWTDILFEAFAFCLMTSILGMIRHQGNSYNFSCFIPTLFDTNEWIHSQWTRAHHAHTISCNILSNRCLWWVQHTQIHRSICSAVYSRWMIFQTLSNNYYVQSKQVSVCVCRCFSCPFYSLFACA